MKQGGKINKRIKELNQVIADSLNDTSINGAKVWAAAHKERESLLIQYEKPQKFNN